MRIERRVTLAASPDEVWEVLVDPANWYKLMHGLTRFNSQGASNGDDPERIEEGSRFHIRMHVGSADVGGLIEIAECNPCREIAWTNITGIDQRGRWRLRERGPNRTSVVYRMSYQAPGGLIGWVTDQISAPVVRNYVRHTLENLKRHIESTRAEQTGSKHAKPAKRQAARA